MTIRDFERALRGHVPGLLGAAREYAVLVPLVERDGAPHLLFEVRASTLSRQPGEVCFPGGQIEAGETKEQCALRETWEELGILPEAVRVIGRLDYVYHRAGFLLHPVLGLVESRAVERMRLNEAEVESTFLMPVSFFAEHPPKVYTYRSLPQIGEDFPYAKLGFSGGYRWAAGVEQVPVYENEGPVIWGLTARITAGLMDAVKSRETGD